VRAQADRLKGADDVDTARACFEWVRDHIQHSSDHGLETVTCSASDVLAQGSGFCYAKSHLLAGLLRANGVPAGFVYQRLAIGDGRFCLHGLNAVRLPTGDWYRIDARGMKPGLVAEFTPPVERLPFDCAAPGERLFPSILADPLPIVIEALASFHRCSDLLLNLPDAEDPAVQTTGEPT
jgi:transglutaminase-like putative cysteine protease